MFWNKRGQIGGGEEPLGGMMMGVLAVIILFFISGAIYTAFFSPNKIDNTSLNGFSNVAQGVSKVYQQRQSIGEPVQIGTDYLLVGFGRDEKIKDKPCISTKIIKPSVKECSGVACLCICENTGREEMCTLEKTKCVPFKDAGFDFADDCNVAFGKGKPQMVRIEMGSSGMLIS